MLTRLMSKCQHPWLFIWHILHIRQRWMQTRWSKRIKWHLGNRAGMEMKTGIDSPIGKSKLRQSWRGEVYDAVGLQRCQWIGQDRVSQQNHLIRDAVSSRLTAAHTHIVYILQWWKSTVQNGSITVQYKKTCIQKFTSVKVWDSKMYLLSWNVVPFTL